MTKQKSKINIKNLDFESALSDLEGLVEKLGSGKVKLEEMVDLYEKGIALRDHCNNKLSDAQMKVEVLVKKELATSKE